MKIAAGVQSFYQRAKRAVGEAIVGDDFFRQGGGVDGVILGASGGAVVGGAIGAAKGMYDQASDQVSEVQVTKQIKDPTLIGHRYSVREDWDEDMFCDDDDMFCDEDLSGWWHNYSPDISNRVVGNFEMPTLKHSHSATVVNSALAGAAVGAGVGAGLGLATGIATRFLGGHPLERKTRLPSHIREQLIADSGNNVAKSTAIGAGVGAAVGLGAGLLEQSKSANITRTWSAPVMESKNLGSIPRDHYEWNWGSDWNDPSDFSDHSPKGTESVIRQVPVLDASGQPTFQEVTKTIDSTRLTPLGGMVGGLAAGAGIGFAVGVASSVINRVIVQSGLE